MTSFHLMSKPVSYKCNLDCTYCYYLEKEHHFLPSSKGRHMPDKILEQYVKQYIEANSGEHITFAWQGGEPTLAGIDFYKKTLSYQQKYANGKAISNSFQTNGILINEQWAKFFKDNQFLVGVSIDGPQEIHDQYRLSNSQKPTHAKVVQAIETLKQYQVEFNTLTVIHSNSLPHAKLIYRYLVDEIRSQHLQFIPIVEYQSANSDQLIFPSQGLQSQATSWSISGKAYGQFMSEVFQSWISRDLGKVHIQTFEDAFAAWLGYEPSLCIHRKHCGNALVLEQNGDVYSCDHYVYPEFKLGNLRTNKLSSMVKSKKQKAFSTDKSKLNHECHTCEFLFACHGGCPKHRVIDIGKKYKKNHLCEGYKHLYQSMKPHLDAMVLDYKQQTSTKSPQARI